MYRSHDSLKLVAQGYDQPALLMTKERSANTTNDHLNHSDAIDIAHHLLKVFEVFDASMRQLPQLENFELHLHTYHWDDVLLTRFVAIRKGDALWVDCTGVQCEVTHRYDGFDGYGAGYPRGFDPERDPDPVTGAPSPHHESSIMRILRAPLALLEYRIHWTFNNGTKASR
jgi:hypothetical protein